MCGGGGGVRFIEELRKRTRGNDFNINSVQISSRLERREQLLLYLEQFIHLVGTVI